MSNKLDNFVTGVAGLINLGCIVALAGMGLKRNNDCYKAECENIDLRCEMLDKDIRAMTDKWKIDDLEREVKTLKEKYESGEEGEA